MKLLSLLYMGLLSLLFGSGTPKDEIKKAIAQGAAIVDVRTPEEYRTGHISGSINIPIDSLTAKTDKLKAMNKQIIVCCHSGGRSANAARYLRQQGIPVLDAGAWVNLK